MKTLLIPLIALAVLSGCAAQPGPETRPYSAEESFQLSMESLNRRGLSFDDYTRERARLIRSQAPQAQGLVQQVQVQATGRDS